MTTTKDLPNTSTGTRPPFGICTLPTFSVRGRVKFRLRGRGLRRWARR